MKVSAFVLLHKKHSIESVSGNNYRMMIRALLYIVILMCFTTSSAQIIETGESNPVWGVRAAFDVNLPGKIHGNVIDDRMFRNGTGVTVGTVCNIFLGKKFYLEPAVSLFYDTYSYKGVTITGINYEESDPTVYKFGIRIPVVVGYSICLTDRISIAPFTGPEMSYSFAGAMKIHDKEKLELDDTSIFSKFGNQRRFECGWKIGVAFFTGMWSFNIDGTIGLTNLMTNGTRFHENRGSVSLTRYF